jgi:hypothetical protein
VLEDFPLDFGRKSTLTHDDDGRPQAFQSFLILAGNLIDLRISRRLRHPLRAIRCPRACIASRRPGGAPLVFPPRDSGGVVAQIILVIFS